MGRLEARIEVKGRDKVGGEDGILEGSEETGGRESAVWLIGPFGGVSGLSGGSRASRSSRSWDSHSPGYGSSSSSILRAGEQSWWGSSFTGELSSVSSQNNRLDSMLEQLCFHSSSDKSTG